MKYIPFMYYTLEAVIFFNKPYYDGKEWNNHNPTNEIKPTVYLSETRAQFFNVPVKHDEEPSAYVYSVYGQGDEVYMPVYERSNSHISLEKLYPKETVAKF